MWSQLAGIRDANFTLHALNCVPDDLPVHSERSSWHRILSGTPDRPVECLPEPSCRDVYRSFAFPFEPWPPPDREPERLRLELFCTPLFLPVPDGPGRFTFFFAPDAMLFALSFTVAPLLAA
jgi:hypothetical protein